MVSVPDAQTESPPLATAVEDPLVKSGATSSDLLSIAVTDGRYKSITPPLEWPDIPSLTVLTGLNGSGKTQLLEAIDIHYHPYLRQQRGRTDIQLAVTGKNFSGDEVLLLENISKAVDANSDFGMLQHEVSRYGKNERIDNPFEDSIARLVRPLIVEKGAILPPSEVLGIFYANPSQIERAVAHHFTAYVLALADCLLQDPRSNHAACRERLGPAPWDELNRSLELAAFSYRFVAPSGLSLGHPISLRLRHVETDEELFPRDLSGGEATIIHFLLFNFAARHDAFKLKLLLLDEPDAHLHTSLIHVFLGLLRELTTDYCCHVIMSTHRIETIALAPEESLFVMHREAPRVRVSDDRYRTIRMLTGNVVGILLANRRPVFVEDVDDAEFYRAAFTVVKDERHWDCEVAPEFLASSTWAARQKIAGGSDLVRNMVSTLRTAGDETVKGLIDLDNGNLPDEGIVVLDRYAIENYLIDPLVVFAFLLDVRKAPEIEISEPVLLGLEGAIKRRNNNDLQKIADAVLELLEPHITSPVSDEERAQDVIEYTNGSEIRVPRWLLVRRGHDLMAALRKASSPRANQRELTKALLKVRLIPKALRRILWEATGCVE